MDDTITRLQEIEARYQSLDPGPWAWRQGYGIGNRMHWALESPTSAADGRVVSYLTVLHHCYPESFGESVEDDPYLRFIAHSRDDIEWLCQQLHAALEARSPWPRPDWSQAPDWATWWAVDPDGICNWFSQEPILTEYTSARNVIGPHWSHVGSKQSVYDAINIPLGVDWRLLKQRRPS